jgi:hypothetical protein
MPWYSYLSLEPVKEILLTAIAGCYVYAITGLQVTAGHSPLGVAHVRPNFRVVSAIS